MLCIAAATIAAPLVGRIHAQGTTPALVNFHKPVPCPGQVADELGQSFYASGADAAKAFKAAVGACKFKIGSDTAPTPIGKDSSTTPSAFLTGNRYYLVSLITTVGSTTVAAGAVQPQILHFLVHDGYEDYRLILPGLSPKDTVYAVVLYSGSSVDFVSTATESFVPNALVTNAGAFFQQVTPAAFWINAVRANQAAPAVVAPIPTLYGQIGDLPIRFRNASISVTEMANVAPLDNLTKYDTLPIKKQLATIKAKYVAFGSSSKACADTLSRTVYGKLIAKDRLDEAWKDLAETVPTAVGEFHTTGVAPDTSCGLGRSLSLTEAQAVLADYASAVAAPTASQITGSATIANARRVALQFTAVVGMLVGGLQGGDQVSVNTSTATYQANPLSRGMTMAAVAVHPVAFDSTTAEMTMPERLSLLGGFVLTPTGGFGIGGSFGIVRGLSLNAGTAWLVVSKGPSGQQPGAPVAATGNVLVTGLSRSWFFGGNYVFGK